jgi:hypothetical protein
MRKEGHSIPKFALGSLPTTICMSVQTPTILIKMLLRRSSELQGATQKMREGVHHRHIARISDGNGETILRIENGQSKVPIH